MADTPSIPELLHAGLAAWVEDRIKNCPEGMDPLGGITGRTVVLYGMEVVITTLDRTDPEKTSIGFQPTKAYTFDRKPAVPQGRGLFEGSFPRI